MEDFDFNMKDVDLRIGGEKIEGNGFVIVTCNEDCVKGVVAGKFDMVKTITTISALDSIKEELMKKLVSTEVKRILEGSLEDIDLSELGAEMIADLLINKQLYED